MKNDILLKLGYKIKYERTKKGISQEELAELSGLSVRTISALEIGSSNIRFTNLYSIVKALNLNLGDFSDFKL